MSDGDEALATLRSLRLDLTLAADAILASAEVGLARMAAARNGDTQALDVIEEALNAVLEACAFQDLAGQRLTEIERLLSDGPVQRTGDEALMNGPALHGQGLDQAAADALFEA